MAEKVWCEDMEDFYPIDEVTETVDGCYIYDTDLCPICTIDTGAYYWDLLCFDGDYAWDTSKAYEYPDKAVEDGVLWKDALTQKYYTVEKTPYAEIHGEKYTIKSAEKIIYKLLENLEIAVGNLETAQNALDKIEGKLDELNAKTSYATLTTALKADACMTELKEKYYHKIIM